MTGRERVLKTMRGEAADALPNMPITMMKAADVAGVTYLRYASDADAHVRGQAAISRAFSIDHVSGISDPAVEASDLGAEVFYRTEAPPAVDEARALLADPRRLAALRVPDPCSTPRMAKRIEVIRRLSREVGHEKAVEGWIEGPIAEACDLRGLARIMTDFYDDPAFVRDLVAFVLEVETAFAAAQVAAGADYIGIGDAAASLIGPDLYREFVREPEKELVAAVHRLGVPVRLHICGNIVPLLGMLGEVGADLVDLDSMVPMAAARAALGPGTSLAGNINPVADLRNSSPRQVEELLAACFRDAGGRRYAVAAGCEVPRDTPDENLRAMGVFARAHAPKEGTT